MNLDNINKWLTLSANLGVLIGIIFLAIEINQTNSIANVQFEKESFDSILTSYSERISDPLVSAWTKAVSNSPDLTEKDLVVIDLLLTREWVRAVQSLKVAENGFSSNTPQQLATEWVFQYLGNKIARKWWIDNYNQVIGRDPILRGLIDAELEKLGEVHDRFLINRINSLKNASL